MINLENVSGLPIEVNKDYSLRLFDGLTPITPSIRKLSEVVPVLKDPNVKLHQNEMYYMYRDIHLPEHEELIRHFHIRYDITVMPPMMLGDEYNKTVGHYHPYKSGLSQKIAYPEVYEVLHGEALFLLQKSGASYDDILSVLAVKAGTGEKIIYPPNYGHIVINVGSDVLVTANWVADNFNSIYKPVAEHRGMAYYVVKDEVEQFKFVPNANYKELPPVRMIDTRFMSKLAISGSQPMYTTGVANPQSLEFLNNPEKYIMELAGITS